MWLLVGLILIFRMGRENRVFYGAGAFFLLLGGWWLADAIRPENLFAGVWGWVLRGITAVALIFMCLAFFQENKKSKKDSSDQDNPEDDEK
jgi:apolipoprotein N-acyltransferase